MTHHHQFDSVVILATTFVTATVITSFVVTMGVMMTLAVIRDVMAVVVVVVMGLNRYFRILAWLVWPNLVKNSNFHTFGSMINFHRSFNLVALFAATKT